MISYHFSREPQERSATLELHHRKARQSPEITKISRGDSVANERRHANEQIRKRYPDSLGLILSVDLSCAKSDGYRDRVNRYRDLEFLEELQSLCFPVRRISACRSMCQLYERDHADADVGFRDLWQLGKKEFGGRSGPGAQR